MGACVLQWPLSLSLGYQEKEVCQQELLWHFCLPLSTGMGSDMYWVQQTLDVPCTYHHALGSLLVAGLAGSHGLTVAPSLLPKSRVGGGGGGEPECSP